MIPDQDEHLHFITPDPDRGPDTAPEPVATTKHSTLRGLGAVVVAAALSWLVINGGASEDVALPPTTTVPPPDPAPIPLEVATEPMVTGALRDDRIFEVYETSPGVLCAALPDEPPETNSFDTCHLELESASGPRLIDDLLVFGYLPPGTDSASVRYRSGQPSNIGIRLEPTARFFALPLRSADPYRLQYRDADYEVESEVPLFAVRAGASQSPEDAVRDGVPTEIAELSFNDRLDIVAEWTAVVPGPVVWSRPPAAMSTRPDWGELLVLDPAGTRIERSIPIPSVQLSAQLSRPEAHYFLGERVIQDQAIVAIVRIDRMTGEPLIVVYPQRSTTDGPGFSPVIENDQWEIGPTLPPLDLSRIGGLDDVVQLTTADGFSIQLDGDTLLPLE